MPTESLIWKIAESFGFPAACCVLLIAFIWVRGREIAAELGRVTRALTLVVLSMQFAPQLHKEEAQSIYEESEEAARKRKEDITHELSRKRRKLE